MSARLVHGWVEERDHHLYVWRIPPEPSTADIEDALVTIQRWIRGLDEPYGWVTDPRVLRITVVALQRKILADHLRKVEPYSGRHCAGMATIVTSPTVRGIGTAVAWLYDYPFPVTYSASESEAVAWVRARMAAGKVRARPTSPRA